MRFDTRLETMGSFAAFDEPPTEINDDERCGDGKDEAADNNHAHQYPKTSRAFSRVLGDDQ